MRPDDPDALPIAPHFLRTEFTKISDQWRSDIANANGRLSTNVLDLPPAASVREVFVLGFEKTNILEPAATFGPHEAWPSIAASLHDQGTAGPYWFIVRRTTDYGQLRARMAKAGVHSKMIRTRLDEFQRGIAAIEGGEADATTMATFAGLLQDSARAESYRGELADRVESMKGKPKGLPDTLAAEVVRVANGEIDLGPVLVQLLDAKLPQAAERYWTSRLCEAAFELEDAPALVAALGTPSVGVAHSTARKALRLIDFRTFGPPMKAAH